VRAGAVGRRGGGRRQAAQRFIEGQMDTWAQVVKANGIKPD
jgi:hypothetical protein